MTAEMDVLRYVHCLLCISDRLWQEVGGGYPPQFSTTRSLPFQHQDRKPPLVSFLLSYQVHNQAIPYDNDVRMYIGTPAV
jgi:hypothetical protein